MKELQTLLKAAPLLANSFAKLAKMAHDPALKKFCREGVTYTRRRVKRIRQALKVMDAPATGRPSSGLQGLIADAQKAHYPRDTEASDLRLLAAIERISHYGLAIYTSIDRFLRAIHEAEARKILVPCQKEKRDAIGEMSRMARRKLLPKLRNR